MKLTQQERKLVESAVIRFDTCPCLITCEMGKLIKLIDRLAQEPQPVSDWHPCRTCGTQMPCPNGCERQRKYDGERKEAQHGTD